MSSQKPGTFVDVNDFINNIPNITIGTKKPYGPEITGCMMSRLNFKGNPVRVQFGVDVFDEENANSLDCLKTAFGICLPPKKNEDSSSHAPPAGVPLVGGGGWGSAAPMPSNPMASAMNQSYNAAANTAAAEDAAYENITRRSLDLQTESNDSLMYQSLNKLEQHCLNIISMRSIELVGKEKMSSDTIEALFTGILSTRKDGSTKFLNTKIDINKAVFRLARKDNTIVDAKWSDVKKGSNLTVMLDITGIYFQKQMDKMIAGKNVTVAKSFGFVMNVSQVLIYESAYKENEYSIFVNPNKYTYVASESAAADAIEHQHHDGNNPQQQEERKRKRDDESQQQQQQPNKRSKDNDETQQTSSTSNNDDGDDDNRLFVMPGMSSSSSSPFAV